MGQIILSAPSPMQITVGVLGWFVLLVLYKILAYIFRHTELTNIPGPKRGHVLFGNMKAVIKAEPSEQHALWAEEYGHVYVYHGLGNVRHLTSRNLASWIYPFNSGCVSSPLMSVRWHTYCNIRTYTINQPRPNKYLGSYSAGVYSLQKESTIEYSAKPSTLLLVQANCEISQESSWIRRMRSISLSHLTCACH